MLKRTLIALTFVAALCAAGFGGSSTAQAGHGCGYDGGYGGGYGSYGYRTYYPAAPYYGYGYGPRVAPRVSYYRSYDRGHHGRHGHRHHDDHGHGGVSISFGF